MGSTSEDRRARRWAIVGILLTSTVGTAVMVASAVGIWSWAWDQVPYAGRVVAPTDPDGLRTVTDLLRRVDTTLEDLPPLPGSDTDLDADATLDCTVGYDSFIARGVEPSIEGRWAIPSWVDPIEARQEAADLLASHGWTVEPVPDHFGQVWISTHVDGTLASGTVTIVDGPFSDETPAVALYVRIVMPNPCPIVLDD